MHLKLRRISWNSTATERENSGTIRIAVIIVKIRLELLALCVAVVLRTVIIIFVVRLVGTWRRICRLHSWRHHLAMSRTRWVSRRNCPAVVSCNHNDLVCISSGEQVQSVLEIRGVSSSQKGIQDCGKFGLSRPL